MPITRTKLHTSRVVDQIKSNLVGLQRDMRQNARAHKQMAVAQSPQLSTLQTFVGDCVNEYSRRLKWVDDLFSDSPRRSTVSIHLSQIGWGENDITDVVTDLRAVIVALKNAPRATYGEIVAACDVVISQVEAPDSLWPE